MNNNGGTETIILKKYIYKWEQCNFLLPKVFIYVLNILKHWKLIYLDWNIPI